MSRIRPSPKGYEHKARILRCGSSAWNYHDFLAAP